MKKYIFTFLLLFSCGILRSSSQLKVSGRVFAEAGSPLAFASVFVKEKMIGVCTDKNGEYSLNLPDEQYYTLSASYIGYEPQEIKVSGAEKDNVDFSLPEDMLNVNTVVVTATRTPKLLKDVPIQTRVITADEIRKVDATNIGDLLQAELPAVEFSFSMNQQTSLNLQGFGGTSVLFLVDGERLAGETLDNVDYSRLNLDNVERVEIVKGAASSLYGSNAVGGVVNIITKEADKPWAVNLNTRYGTHNAQRHGASASFNQGRFNSVTDFQYNSIDSYSLSAEGDISTLLGNSSYTFKERLGIDVSDRVKLIARGGYYFRERDNSSSIKNRYRDFNGGLRMNYDMSRTQYLDASYSFDQYDKSNYYTGSSKDIRNYSNIQNTARVMYNRIFEEGHTLTLGGDGMTDYLMSYQFENNESYKMYSADAFVQFDFQLTPNMSVVSGLRLDYFSKLDDINFSPKLAMMYRLDKWAFRGSYSAGFRAPTLKEMYMDFDMASVFNIYGNPDLKSETSHNAMLSAEYTNRYWNVTAAGYYNIVNDRIGTVWNAELYGMEYMNTRQVNVAGADANISLKLPCGFGGRLSYAYTREYMKKGETRTSDARPHTALLRLEYGKNFRDYGFIVMLTGRFMSAVDTHTLTSATQYQEYAEVHYPGYTLWKLTVSQKVCRFATVNFAVDNLFNYKPSYFYYNSPTAYGTLFSIGLSVNLEQLFVKR
ncbi:MAG: TonB-dependent receptor [Rikenellaceae bacterium]|nr:TonB-dependent receptor [Rikenellaceae bacterium]